MTEDYKVARKNREFLKDTIRLETDFSATDQALGYPMPPLEKDLRADQKRIQLPDPQTISKTADTLVQVLFERQSHRSYSLESLTLSELSFLLMATQGVRQKVNKTTVFRTVPSAGNRHPFETYLAVFRIEGLKPGIYRYLPLTHALVLEKTVEKLEDELVAAALGQKMAGRAAVTFIWTVLPYRTEWRYSKASAKVIAMDLGHVCQNLYLAAGLLDCGTCSIGAYHQLLADALLELDGEDEFTVAMAPVGKLR